MIMTNNLKDKKILILGGGNLASDIVSAANKLGVHTIVTDWNQPAKSPAKLLADEHFEISITDYPAILNLIKTKHIDGVITGFADSYLIPYTKICKSSSLPCYATQTQFEETLDKNLFKQKCIENGIDVVPEYSIQDIINNQKLPCNKVIIKPVDNSGSRGIALVENYSDFEESLKTSLSYSEKNHVIVERYMDCDDVSLCYTLQDGHISLSAICDRYIHKTSKFGSVTSGLIYPSVYTDLYLKKYDRKVRQMFKNMELKNGVLFMQAFVENDSFYFYEMGYRLSGGRHYIFTKEINGISAIDSLINFAITGRMSDEDIRNVDNPKFNKICSQVSVLCSSEKIGQISGLNEIKNFEEVKDISQMYNENDIVGPQGTTMQIFARIHIVVDNIIKLQQTLLNIKKTLKVVNDHGDNMILDFFTFDEKKY